MITKKEYAGDWIWIVDHTIQLGCEKCLVILGVRMFDLPPSGTCLTHDCLEPITLVPLKTSTGEIVFEPLEESIKKTGIPREIIGDYGSDLKAGIVRFCQAHPETDYIHDIKHKTALLLKKELENNEAWINFTRLAAQTKLEIQQTSLAFLSPPAQRSKSRDLNLEILVQWGQKVLTFLLEMETDENVRIMEKLGWVLFYRQELAEWGEIMQVIGITESHVRQRGYFLGSHQPLKQSLPQTSIPNALRMSQQLLDFVLEQELKVQTEERLLGSSEVIESVLDQQKYLEHEQSKSGFTGLLLGIPAMVGRLTTAIVSEALENVSTAQVLEWCQQHLGQTLQGKRMEAFAIPKAE